MEYGLQNYLMNNPRYMRLYSIEGGNERLTRELAARVDAEILLHHRVTALGETSSGRQRVECSYQVVRCSSWDYV